MAWNAFDPANTPSRLDGISQSEEDSERAKSILFIEELSVELRSNRIVVATACVLFHRFYALQSLKSHNRFIVASASLFLATKVEEENRSLDSITCASLVVRKRASPSSSSTTITGTSSSSSKKYRPDPNSQEVKDLTNSILLLERLILQTLCFELQICHPYEYMIDSVNKGIMKSHIDNIMKKEFISKITHFLNDSYRSTLCLSYKPDVIAAGAIYLTVLQMNLKPIKVSSNINKGGQMMNNNERTWADILKNDCNIDEGTLRHVCDMILNVYQSSSQSSNICTAIDTDGSGSKDRSDNINNSYTKGNSGSMYGSSSTTVRTDISIEDKKSTITTVEKDEHGKKNIQKVKR
jgi:transcription initiation factor TFIIIB Brf1 subunit/transcription initiation factor TFIIB